MRIRFVIDDGAFPLGLADTDGQGLEIVAACVLQERRRRIETHGLIVEETGVELGGAVELQPRAGVGEHGEADGVGLRETIGGKRGEWLAQPFR